MSVMLAGLAKSSPTPTKKPLSSKTAAHCCVDMTVRNLIHQLLPYSRTMSRDVFNAVQNLVSQHRKMHKLHKFHSKRVQTKKWIPTTASASGSSNNKPQVVSLTVDMRNLACFHHKIQRSIAAYRQLPQTKSRDAVITKLIAIDNQIIALYSKIHHAQKALSSSGSKKPILTCRITVLKPTTKHTHHKIVKELVKVLSDLHGELRIMGVDFIRLRKVCPVASVQAISSQTKALPCL